MAGSKYASNYSDNCSDTSDEPLELDPSTKALLDMFLRNKAEEDRRFAAMEETARLQQMDISGALDEDEIRGIQNKPMISVREYKETFSEDWQLSQFWYSEEYAYRFAKAVHELCTPETKIAFLCCPTTYVAFQHLGQLPNCRLFEFDKRFRVLAPKEFVFYDLDEPEDVPSEFHQYFDFVIADPPFLNEVTNQKLIRTLHKIMRPGAKFCLHTSIEMENNGTIQKLYTSQNFGPLRRTAFEPEHGQLANDFASWGNWEGAEAFGEEAPDEN